MGDGIDRGPIGRGHDAIDVPPMRGRVGNIAHLRTFGPIVLSLMYLLYLLFLGCAGSRKGWTQSETVSRLLAQVVAEKVAQLSFYAKQPQTYRPQSQCMAELRIAAS